MPDNSHPARIDLQILATTDLHMNLFHEEEDGGRQGPLPSLARVATAIENQRKACKNTLLFDNGDFLQGTPLADFLAESAARKPDFLHPAIAAMNLVGYDAITLGNHDFAFGGDFLRKVLRKAHFSVSSANLSMERPERIRPSILLNREFSDRDGRNHLVRIGVIGLLPPQTPCWDRSLQSFMSVRDMAEAVGEEVSALRFEGAHAVILLAHSGIDSGDYRRGMENGATALAALQGVDAVIAGHTHLVFPAPDFPVQPGIDPTAGTLAQKPAVMAGFWGSHLGVIRLVLSPCSTRGWRVESGHSAVQSALSAPPHAGVAAIVRPVQAATRRHFERKVARSDVALDSRFALLGHDAGQRLVSMSQRWHVKHALRGTRWQNLPILATVTPSRAGGRSGPCHYTAIPPGPLNLQHLSELYPYPNRLVALKLSGRDLAQWLERSASAFRQILPDRPDQLLIDPDFPSYNFDAIDGLGWEIDLAQPARHKANGTLAAPDARRISDIRHYGRKVAPDDSFILVTNSYRQSETGLFAGLTTGREVALDDGTRARDVLRRYVTHCRRVEPPAASGFRFRPAQGRSAIFETAPDAGRDLSAIAGFRPEDLGLSPEGFLRLRIHF
ncbi:5'-nucleotidase C-terminal domain-containing protein [Paracoccus cavernae]|uniref:5'-nucleotidase C-terminal domain-containing protein n=2 Tax=Paracoccus cavernae TaxID=1571207 RepID=UPI0036165B01